MNTFKVLIRSFKTFLDDDPLTYAASLAFYTVVSLPAILLIAINILSTAYDRDEIKGDLLSQLNKYLGPNTVSQAETILENATMNSTSILPQVIGWAILVVSATTIFISLQDGINKIWGVIPDPKANWIKLLVDRLLSFAMIFSIGFVLLVSLVIDSILTLFQNYIVTNFGHSEAIFVWATNVALSIFVTTVIFAMIFKTLPDVKTKWKNIWVGGLFTSLMFLTGKFLIGFYLSNSDIGSAYGASGSLVVFLFWVYYSSILVLFGSKFTYEYSIYQQNKLTATENAVFVKEKIISEDEVLTKTLKNS